MSNNHETHNIYIGVRDDHFRQTIRSLLTRGKLTEKYIDLLTNPSSMAIYDQAFTASSANPEMNYEYFEQLGDVSANKFIVWYMYKRFPNLKCPLGVKVVARLRINYGARETFFKLGSELGFWDFITASYEERNHKKKDLLEDCVESFIGATEYLLDTKIRVGVGYAIINDILTSIFDDIDISLKYEDLYDAKTRLKELFDMFSKTTTNRGGFNFYQASWVFVDNRNDKINTSLLYLVPNGVSKTSPEGSARKEWILIGQGTASLKKDSQQIAAQEGLTYLKSIGYVRPVAPEYELFNR